MRDFKDPNDQEEEDGDPIPTSPTKPPKRFN